MTKRKAKSLLVIGALLTLGTLILRNYVLVEFGPLGEDEFSYFVFEVSQDDEITSYSFLGTLPPPITTNK